MATRAVGTLALNMVARTKDFTKGIKTAQKSVSTFGSGVRKVGRQILKFGSVLSGVSVGGLALFLKKQIDAIDNLAKTADKIGVSTENLGAWRHGAQLAGMASEAFDASLTRMVRRVGLFVEKGGAAAKRLEGLGFGLTELAQLSTEDQFIRIAEAMSKLPTHAERSAAAFEIFGMQGQQLLPILMKGSQGLIEMREHYESLGASFSGKQADAVEEFLDRMTDLKALIGGLGQKFVINVAPAAVETIQGLLIIVRAIDRWNKQPARQGKTFMERQFPWSIAAFNWITGIQRRFYERQEQRFTPMPGPLPSYAEYRKPFSRTQELSYGTEQYQRDLLDELRKQTAIAQDQAAELPIKYAFQ